MKDFSSIQENELDGALNALFLDTCSRQTDEGIARFCMEQEYEVIIDPVKEAALIARLGGKQGRAKNIIILIAVLLLIAILAFLFLNRSKEEKKIIPVAPSEEYIFSSPAPENRQELSDTTAPVIQKEAEQKTPAARFPLFAVSDVPIKPSNDSVLLPSLPPPEPLQNPIEEKVLPYFDKNGLAYFARVKERMLQKLVKIDDQLYVKTEPGATMYKNSEVLISPFVMSNFPVTNLQYKVFLADLAREERMDDLKKCLPKEEVWKEYGCSTLAKTYFENEIYNNFPVVNVGQEACRMYCEWLEEQMNQQLAGSGTSSKFKGPVKRKQVVVRLPYDYEWIYSADAAYTLIPDCSGYNTIYDPSEGLVDKGFYKRTSQVSKRELRKETRMDQLLDVNRFGMTEAEMTAIFREAINYKADPKSTGDLSDPSAYPANIEACCLAGHVCELIKNKEGEMRIRGCCWKSKDEFLKMTDVFKKNDASPFVGFRVMIQNTERGSNKNPFW